MIKNKNNFELILLLFFLFIFNFFINIFMSKLNSLLYSNNNNNIIIDNNNNNYRTNNNINYNFTNYNQFKNHNIYSSNQNIINNHINNINFTPNINISINNFSTRNLIQPNISNNFIFNNSNNQIQSSLNNLNNSLKKIINIDEFLQNSNKIPLSLSFLSQTFPSFEKSKISSKHLGIIKAYGANTYQGIIRNYNEDRVSIIINMNKPKNFKENFWPKVSFFGIYDGHGGKECAEYLRDNLHKLICESPNFIKNPIEAIKNGFAMAEKDFLMNHAISNFNQTVLNRSGSCALILITIETKIYIANVGDSRAIMSSNKKLKEITIDHKPNEINEKNRIIKNGGKVYQTQSPLNTFNNTLIHSQILIGPFRVFPGRLSVSRTLGDVEAKNVKFGGKSNVVIAVPDVYCFDIVEDDVDFLILGCDGIFDQLSNKDCFDCAWMVFNEFKDNLHVLCGKVVDLIIKAAMCRKSFDNVTCLVIVVKEYEKFNIVKNNNFDIKKNEEDFNKKNIIENSEKKEKIIIENKETIKNFNNNNNLNNNINNNNNNNSNINLKKVDNLLKTNNSNNLNTPNRNIKNLSSTISPNIFNNPKNLNIKTTPKISSSSKIIQTPLNNFNYRISTTPVLRNNESLDKNKIDIINIKNLNNNNNNNKILNYKSPYLSSYNNYIEAYKNNLKQLDENNSIGNTLTYANFYKKQRENSPINVIYQNYSKKIENINYNNNNNILVSNLNNSNNNFYINPLNDSINNNNNNKINLNNNNNNNNKINNLTTRTYYQFNSPKYSNKLIQYTTNKVNFINKDTNNYFPNSFLTPQNPKGKIDLIKFKNNLGNNNNFINNNSNSSYSLRQINKFINNKIYSFGNNNNNTTSNK